MCVLDVLSIVLGCGPWFASVVAIAAPHTSIVAVAAAVGALVCLLALRQRRTRWLREVALYESYDAFAAFAKQHAGTIHHVGWAFLFRGPLGLLGRTRRASIRDAYQLQNARRRTAITEPEYRAAIDELLERAADRACP